jgi:hypothetical protein
VAAKNPELSVTLKAHESQGAIDYLDVVMVAQGVTVAKDGALVKMPLVVASIPTARYDGDALTIRDAQGPVGLNQREGPPMPFGTEREWIASRATTGPLTVSFRSFPRKVDSTTRPGPLFDLRGESGGLMGAGVTFLPYFVHDGPFDIKIHWDLSGLPPTERAVSCFGDGDAGVTATSDEMRFCYYAVGPLHVYPADAGTARRFGIYWLTEPPFDIAKVSSQIQTLFGYMSNFFHDDGGAYRVFIRKNPYPSGGGTAAHRSFMFGWSSDRPSTADALEDLLAHEMTHNWPELEGDHGDTSWYSEGNAEYYSILLSWRSGVIDADEFLKRVNQRARNYYQNPLQNLSLHEAEERYWNEANASYVPYGRGFMYLAKTDAAIRARSDGKRSLDDLVITLVDRARRGESHKVSDWLDLVTKELGPGARSEFDDMVAGRRIVPPANTFGPCFKPETYQGKLNDLGFDESSLSGSPKVIKGLRADSNAARAGLKEGDEVLHHSPPDQDEPNKETMLTVKRGGAQQSITFSPEGKPVEVYRWVRVTGITSANCHY